MPVHSCCCSRTQTALHLAARRGCLPMIRLLLRALQEAGPRCAAALQRRDASGDTPASAAHKGRHTRVEAEIVAHLRQLRLTAAHG